MLELIGCPMHLGVSDDGLKDAVSALNARFPELAIREIPEVILPEEGLPNLKNLNSVAVTCEKIAEEEYRVLSEGNTPLFIGGDHAAAIGSISGAAAACREMGLLWVDAHSDINTDVTTLTGNIHGMPVAALMGFGNEKLCSVFSEKFSSPETPKVLPQHTVLYGVRDMDPLEISIIERLNVRVYTWEEIAARGQAECLQEAAAYLSECRALHLSFDLDSMDPSHIRGVTVPVKGGFSEADVFFLFDWLRGHCLLCSIDIVEYNPRYDTDGVTGGFVSRLIQRIR